MQTTAKLQYIRIAPRKVRLVADRIRGKRVGEARLILRVTARSAAEPLQKLVKSAVVSARNNFQIEESNLYIAKIAVDEGPKLKRFRPRARGRAYPIQKKTSHVTLVLEEIVPSEQDQKTKATKLKGAVSQAGEGGSTTKKSTKARFRPEREQARAKSGGMGKRFFRRKAI